MKRGCGVYQHPDVLLLHGERRAEAGFTVASAPVRRLSPDATESEIGSALRSVLAAYVADEPDPPDLKQHRDAFLKATGFRSWKELEGSAKSCWISEEDGTVTLTPLKNGGRSGPSKGFQPFGAADVVVPSASSDHETGRALLKALAISQ